MSGFTLPTPDPLTIGSLYATSAIRNNGIETIVSATPPSTRADSTALQENDRWIDTVNKCTWIRNAASQWVSEDITYISSGNPLAVTFGNATRLTYNCKYTGFLITSAEVNYLPNATIDASNYHTISLSASTYDGSAVSSVILGLLKNTIADTPAVYRKDSFSPNVYRDALVSGVYVTSIGIDVARIGTTSSLAQYIFTIGVRDVY